MAESNVVFPHQQMRRRQFADLLIDGMGAGDVLIAQIEIDGGIMDVALDRRMLEQRTQLRGEQNRARNLRIHEGLFAKAVARQVDCAGLSVPQQHGERPRHLLQRRHRTQISDTTLSYSGPNAMKSSATISISDDSGPKAIAGS
jgi:hypothetical protein